MSSKKNKSGIFIFAVCIFIGLAILAFLFINYGLEKFTNIDSGIVVTASSTSTTPGQSPRLAFQGGSWTSSGTYSTQRYNGSASTPVNDSAQNVISGEWLQIELPDPVLLTAYKVTHHPAQMLSLLVAKNKNSTIWTILDRRIISAEANKPVLYNIQPLESFSMFRFIFTAVRTAGPASISAIELFAPNSIPVPTPVPVSAPTPVPVSAPTPVPVSVSYSCIKLGQPLYKTNNNSIYPEQIFMDSNTCKEWNMICSGQNCMKQDCEIITASREYSLCPEIGNNFENKGIFTPMAALFLYKK